MSLSTDQVKFMLEYIQMNTGRVCDDYENCTHKECIIQYHMWAYADKMLKELEGENPADKIININTRLRGVLQDDAGL